MIIVSPPKLAAAQTSEKNYDFTITPTAERTHGRSHYTTTFFTYLKGVQN